ncbi:MAG TPA: phosphatidylglycerol lysyltransferase domain-containing protein [Elusimicrobiales bacterium]|nr:phosphatidylglycerol lysyltransferase domain-containing protein [Elusimicrobiales bacterium]
MNFLPVSPSEYKRLAPFFDGQPHTHSAYCLSGIVAWNNCAFNNYYAIHDKSVYLYESPESEPPLSYLLMPVSGKREFAPQELLEALRRTGQPEIRFAPEAYVEKHKKELESLFIITEQPEYEDYVYRQSDLAALDGREYAKKRNLLRQFEREYLSKERVKSEPISARNTALCLSLAERWYETRAPHKSHKPQELVCDRKALTQTLHNFDQTGASGLLVLIDGKPAGLGIASRLNPDTAVLNFEKALDEHKGLYQYLDKECAARLCAGFAYINKESDLGDPGLRQAKASYYPALRIKAYSLSPRN